MNKQQHQLKQRQQWFLSMAVLQTWRTISALVHAALKVRKKEARWTIREGGPTSYNKQSTPCVHDYHGYILSQVKCSKCGDVITP